MNLREMRVSGYRGFSTPQTIKFAEPNGKPGSGLTLIVGPNDSGKSSLMEVLSYLRVPGGNVEFIEGQKNVQTNGRIRIEYQTSEGSFSLVTTGGGTVKWENFPPSKPKISAYVLPSRRNIESRFSAEPQNRASFLMQSQNFTSRRPVGSAFPSRLSRIDSSRDKFLLYFNRILPNPPSWYMEKSDPGRGEFYLKVSSSSSPHDSDGLGSGVTSAIHIADALYDSPEEDIIGIDEPELSLHPAAQRRLTDLLIESSRKRQIVLATHSPFFVPFECLDAGMQVARVYKLNKGSAIGQVQESTTKQLTSLLTDANNPHVLGLDAREVLFLEDDAILVEGQEDVIGYRRLLSALGRDIPASFFGWGVGGASKMVVIASLLRDLGVQRVFGILDSDKRNVSEELSRTFPSYKFVTIPAPDIRTKPARKATESKKGLLGEDGELRPEYEKDTKELFAALEQYFVRKS